VASVSHGILRHVFVLGNPIKYVGEFLAIVLCQTAKGFEIGRRENLGIDLADNFQIVAKELKSPVLEEMRVKFNKLQEGKKAGILALVYGAFIPAAEAYAEFRNNETHVAVEPLTVFLGFCRSMEIAFHQPGSSAFRESFKQKMCLGSHGEGVGRIMGWPFGHLSSRLKVKGLTHEPE